MIVQGSDLGPPGASWQVVVQIRILLPGCLDVNLKSGTHTRWVT